jgi:hypothetical protein
MVQRRERSIESSDATKGKEILEGLTGCCLLKKGCAPWSWLLRKRLIVVYGSESCDFSIFCRNILVVVCHFA